MSQLWMDATTEGGGPKEGNEIYYFQQRAREAASACQRISESERMLGYETSADDYQELAAELNEAGTWLLSSRSDVEKYHGMFIPAALRGFYGEFSGRIPG